MTALQEATTDLAESFFRFASQGGKVDPFGQAIEIDDFAATLADETPYHYVAPSGRASKNGDRWLATIQHRGRLVGSLRRGGPAHGPAFTVKKVSMGTYALVTPERAIVTNRNVAKVAGLSKYLQKEGTRLFNSVDFTSNDAPATLRAELHMILQPLEMVQGQLNELEKYSRKILVNASEQIKKLAAGSDAYVFGAPDATIHQAWRGGPPKQLSARP
jgi:hypothetical protein